MAAARIVLASPTDALAGAEDLGVPLEHLPRGGGPGTAAFDHVLVEQAATVPLVHLVALAAGAARSTLLAAELDERPPPPPPGTAPAHHRWLAAPITELLGLVPPAGPGAPARPDHPTVLRLD
ncbi:MAG: hypothetical protein ABW208_22625 [Pyrinomonadaceae bacterium]